MPRLWSSLSVLVTTRSMSLMPKILSSSRFQSVEKLRIQSPLSKRVSESILRHLPLRDFEVIMESGKKTMISILKLICSIGSRGIVLNLDGVMKITKWLYQIKKLFIAVSVNNEQLSDITYIVFILHSCLQDENLISEEDLCAHVLIVK